MIAATLEHNGATVYIAARRLEVIEKAARENNVSTLVAVVAYLLTGCTCSVTVTSFPSSATSRRPSPSKTWSKRSRRDTATSTYSSTTRASP